MKKTTLRLLAVLCLCFALCLCLAACGGDDEEDSPSAGEIEQPSEEPEQDAEETDPPPADDTPEPQEPQEPAYELSHIGNRLYENSIGTVWSQTIIEVHNTGAQNLYLSSASYDLEDSSGALVAAQSYVSAFPDVLQPGEKGWIYEETTLDNVSADTVLTVLPHENIEEATVDCIRLPVSDFSLTDDEYFGVKALGRVENNTGSDIDDMLYVVAGLYDSAGAPIGLIFTIITDPVAAGEKVGFELSGFSLPADVTSSAVADYVVYAYPLQFQF